MTYNTLLSHNSNFAISRDALKCHYPIESAIAQKKMTFFPVRHDDDDEVLKKFLFFISSCSLLLPTSVIRSAHSLIYTCIHSHTQHNYYLIKGLTTLEFFTLYCLINFPLLSWFSFCINSSFVTTVYKMHVHLYLYCNNQPSRW